MAPTPARSLDPETARPDEKMRVYVHLAHGFDAVVWQARWASNELLGINERTPYGYHRAASMGCEVVFSQDRAEGFIRRAIRGAARLVLGFDLVHAYRNRHRILAAEVVWTHTESQYLAVLALFGLLRVAHRPRVLAQSVWLMDSWPRLPVWKRQLYTSLIARADILTFHSSLNRQVAELLFPKARCEVVYFGINAATQAPPFAGPPNTPLHILSLGNDRHRDWATLIAAFGGDPAVALRIASKTIDRRLAASHDNIVIEAPAHNDALKDLYRWADVVVLPLKANLHASGITVLQEAVLFGRPVVCTRVGGLTDYFPPDEVVYVEPGDAVALRSAVLLLASDAAAARRRATQAQARMTPDRLSSDAFVRRHVEVSRQLVRTEG